MLKPLLISRKNVQELLCVGTTKFYELKKAPGFPQARYLGKRPMYFLEEVEEWAKSISHTKCMGEK